MRVLAVLPATDLTDIMTVHGVPVETAEDVEDAVFMMQHNYYDVVCVGGALALDLLSVMRRRKINTCCIVVTITMPLKFFEAGADDVINPTRQSNAEMLARFRALARRRVVERSNTITAGEIMIDTVTKAVSCGGRDVHLTGKEYALLELLMRNKGRVITKAMALNDLYGGMDEPEEKIIDVFICKLRRKLDTVYGAPVPDGIKTMWGRGYYL